MKILIVDDSSKWIKYHESAIREIFENNVQIDTAECAQKGLEKITLSIDEPYDIVLTDLQMESDFLPLFAGEWFVKQIKFFKEYKNTKIVIISASGNIKQIAEKYGVDYIPKYSCNNLDSYCNKMLK